MKKISKICLFWSYINLTFVLIWVFVLPKNAYYLAFSLYGTSLSLLNFLVNREIEKLSPEDKTSKPLEEKDSKQG